MTGHDCPFPDVVPACGPWRCPGCRRLWRPGYACNRCDYARELIPHRGQHRVGWMWRPATDWQRLTAWLRRV